MRMKTKKGLAGRLGVDAVGLAVVLRRESVVVAVAAAPPEARTAAVLHVEEPLDGEVAARATVLVQAAHAAVQQSILAAAEAAVQRRFASVRTASETRSLCFTKKLHEKKTKSRS